LGYTNVRTEKKRRENRVYHEGLLPGKGLGGRDQHTHEDKEERKNKRKGGHQRSRSESRRYDTKKRLGIIGGVPERETERGSCGERSEEVGKPFVSLN